MKSTNDVVRLEMGDDGVAVVSLTQPDRLNTVDAATRDGLIETSRQYGISPTRGRCFCGQTDDTSQRAQTCGFGTADTIFEVHRVRMGP